MWNTDTIWFTIAIVLGTVTLGQILLGHFEERTPRLRKLLKVVVALGVVIAISIFVSQTAALIVYGIFIIPVLYVHIFYLPKKGINGWTGEPKSKYYELRKWDKDIFGNS